ncbi:MAG: hypothetical protein M1826_007206 [Phylliscum demangeonii]|nr:MAG: hypothetical protein M1826_007206 [Phylliscum demangeonii]
MDDECGTDWKMGDYLKERLPWAEAHFFKAKEDECIKKVNEEIKSEAAGKPTYLARTDTAARRNPYHLETPGTPRRDPRLPYEHRPADYHGDALSYISQENEQAIIFKLKTYDGQLVSSWLLFTECMMTQIGPSFVIANYVGERLEPAQMGQARDQEDHCVSTVNHQIEDDARRHQKQASIPVRTYPPLNPRPQTQAQEQAQEQHQNEFSTAPVAAWAQHAARFVTTESHRLLRVGALARPLRKVMREPPTRLPRWEADLVH